MNDVSEEVAATPGQEARQWAMFCHFAAFIGLVFPFGSLLGPLIVWQLKRESDPFVDAQGKEALNFQITVAQRRQGLSLSVLPAADQVGRTGNRKAGACAGFFVSDRAQMLNCQS